MNKSGKNVKRMSLDPAKQHHSLISQRIYNPSPTQLDVHKQAQDSQISISLSGHDQFPIQEYPRIFATIARGSNRLDSQTLYSLLREEGYGDNLYLASIEKEKDTLPNNNSSPFSQTKEQKSHSNHHPQPLNQQNNRNGQKQYRKTSQPFSTIKIPHIAVLQLSTQEMIPIIPDTFSE